jgi:hypothetical protein
MRSAKPLALAFGIALSTLLAGASSAQAQYGYPPPPPPPQRGMYRGGLTLGGSAGVGAISSQNCGPYCGGAGMIEGHIGGMLNPRLALMGDFWLGVHPWDDGYGTGTTYHGIYTFAVQFWATPILWIKGGVGFANLVFGYDGSAGVSDESGPASMAAIGVEVLQSYNFALDLQFRVGRGFYSEGPDVSNAAFLVGVNWY